MSTAQTAGADALEARGDAWLAGRCAIALTGSAFQRRSRWSAGLARYAGRR